MIPRNICQQLSRLRRREHFFQFVWGGARCLAVVVAVLAGACLVDWLIDLRQDTSFLIHFLLLVGQMLLWSACLMLLGARWSRRQGDAEIALWIEERSPELDHRLISAVQLNQPHADTRGMSPEMIDCLTRDAEERVTRRDFARLVDSRRLTWAVVLAVPVILSV